MEAQRHCCYAFVVLLLVILPACGSPSEGSVDEPPWARKVDYLFRSYTTDPPTPGCALGVFQEDRIVYSKGYGMANLEYTQKITPASVFRIASFSKQFTANCVAQLVLDGHLTADTKIATFFPELAQNAGQVTVYHMVHHLSGLVDYIFLLPPSDCINYDACITVQRILDLLAPTPLEFPPGTAFQYSNTNYVLLAEIVRRVTRQPFRTFSANRIFRSLGMNISHVHSDLSELVPRRATGYSPASNDSSDFIINETSMIIVGDGGVFTSINDLLSWDANFYHNILGHGNKLIDLVLTPGRYNNGTVSTFGGSSYAWGLVLSTIQGLPMVWHNGAYVGFRTVMFRFPTHHWSVAVLCNRADADPSTLGIEVAFLAGILSGGPVGAKDELPSQLPE